VSNELIDIRELHGDADAYRDELFKRWTGLLSYRYIGRKSSSMNLGEVDDTVKVRHDMRNVSGGIMAAPLAIAAPQGCQTDLVAVPNPVVQSVQILDPAHDVEVLEVVPGEFLHQGRMMGYSRTMLVDAADHGRVIAMNEGQGAIIGTPPEGLERMDVEGTEIEVEDSPDLPPLWQVFGASRRDDGHWTLPELSVEYASPDAALHIGPQHVVLETAAIQAGADLAGTDMLQALSWHVMFLARGKVGPFRVEVDAHRGAAGRVGTRMVIHDEGNDDRRITAASAVFEVVD
jgi:hypothetical protein